MRRTDTHRPSAIIPTEYQYVGMEYRQVNSIEDCYAVMAMRKRIQDHMARTGGTYSNHEHGGNCHVCGSVNAIYTHLFYHVPSNTYIRTGTECTDKLDYAGAAEDMNAFRTAIKDYTELQTGKRKAQGILAEAGLSQVWDVYLQEFSASERVPYEEITIREIVGKLIRYGSISEKQMNFVGILVDRINNRAQLEAQRAAEKAIAADCPNGRVNITGTMLKWEVRDSDFGSVTKMLVKSADGFVVWGSMPVGISTDQKGQEVSFTATVEPSEKDPKFGFFKRPRVA